MTAEQTVTSSLDADLVAALADVRAALERCAAASGSRLDPDRLVEAEPGGASVGDDVPNCRWALGGPLAAFGLSSFESGVLLLCAGAELDLAFGPLIAAGHGDAARTAPTFGLALSAFADGHWSALTPGAPLRYWRLVEVGAGPSLLASPLRLDERVLHALLGLGALDEQLAGFVHRVPPSDDPLAPSHRRQADQAAAAWTAAASPLPVGELCGRGGPGEKRALASATAARLGLALHVLDAHALPTTPHELDVLLRLWAREATLSASALLLDADGLDASEAPRAAAVRQALEHAPGPVLVAAPERQRRLVRPRISLDVEPPTTGEQRDLWREALGPAGRTLNGAVDRLATHFTLGAPAIRAAARGGVENGEDGGLADRLWDACRAAARPRLDDLAQRIEPAAAWADLVLPDRQIQTLHDIVAHVRHRMRVYETWGFAAKSARGLGISVLFAGPSGTGKTMAAEVLARALRLDLYRIDLSRVVSKYIGETEKNLARVFDAAEAGGAVLLFDEADALFGKRSEVKDSHDRYANIEVSYLLQRMESYRGLAILTTNLKDSLDDAFLRRLRFAVTFPFPDAALRAEIWRRAFPAATPTEGLDVDALARLNVTGGNIRNVALGAAFLAADADEPVRMGHLLRAARAEVVKLDRPLSDHETRGWT